MTKRFLFLLVAMLGMTLQGIGQVPFGVGFPSPQNFVKVTASGVNLRKAPNTSSPRLVYRNNISDDCLDCDPSLAWSSGQLKRGEKPVNAKMLYICGESGDWWQVKFYEDVYGDGGYTETAYVMKKFCKKLTPRPLSLPAPKDKNIAMVKTGKYKGMCLEWLYGYEDSQILRFGRYIDGVFAFVYSIEFSKNYRDTNDTQFESYDFRNIASLEVHLFDSNGQLNLNKLAEDTKTLDVLMANRNKMTSVSVAYLGFEGDTKWYQWE